MALLFGRAFEVTGLVALGVMLGIGFGSDVKRWWQGRQKTRQRGLQRFGSGH